MVRELDSVARNAVQETREEEERGRSMRRRMDGAQMEKARNATIVLGQTLHAPNVRRHRRNLSTMSDYFDAVGDEHVENDEHDDHSIASAMQSWHANLPSPPQPPQPQHITFPSLPTPTPSTTAEQDIAQALKTWNSRTRMKRRGTNRGMDMLASHVEFSDLEGVLGKMLHGWEETVLALVLLVVMFRLWLLDAFGGRL